MSMKKRVCSFLPLFPLILFFSSSEARPEENRWFTTAYFGFHSIGNFGQSLRFEGTDTNRLAGLGLGKELIGRKFASLEAEALFAEHFGGAGNFQEYVLCLGLRYHYFPWDKFVKTTAAVLEGPSYATRWMDGENQYWHNYLSFEVTLAYPKFDRLSLVYRLHHRSAGENVLHMGGKGESNYYTLGVRYRF